jgi:hypothetical protein
MLIGWDGLRLRGGAVLGSMRGVCHDTGTLSSFTCTRWNAGRSILLAAVQLEAVRHRFRESKAPPRRPDDHRVHGLCQPGQCAGGKSHSDHGQPGTRPAARRRPARVRRSSTWLLVARRMGPGRRGPLARWTLGGLDLEQVAWVGTMRETGTWRKRLSAGLR